MGYSIEMQNLKKTFRMRVKGRSKAVEAVRGVSLAVDHGEIFGFLGPNGAGKTTTLRMLTTLLPIGGGEAFVAGFDIRKKPGDVRRHIGYVSQLGGADILATGMENLLLAGGLYGMKRGDAKRRADELARLLDLQEPIGRGVRTYSGGQKRRLEIALGIMHRPDVLFLDEPSTGLDPQNRANLWDQIRNLRDTGTTIFLTTHYLEEADELADRLAIMDHGKIVAEGTPRELKRQISGDVIMIKPKHGGEAASTKKMLEDREFIREVRLEGDVFYLYVEDGAKVLPKVCELLEANRVQLDTVSVSQPSLDDVFLKQTGRLLRDAGAGKEDPQ